MYLAWHDSNWEGVVCKSPHLNGACAKLKRIAGGKDERTERSIAGKKLSEIPLEKWPCCVDERSTFMAPFEMEHVKRHALARINKKNYGHFQPTTQHYPPFSAGIVPFLWMMRPNIEHYAERFQINVDSSREPELGYDTNWVHEAHNQTSLLEAFASHLQCDRTLCLFYAKHVPFVEGTNRILIGVGRLKSKGKLIEYDRKGDGPRGMIWERPIQHSIRPGFKDGFLMPYQDLLRRAEQDPFLDLEQFTAYAPTEHWNEFSFGSEIVTHDGAISALLSMDAALSRIESDLDIPTRQQRKWLHEELTRLWLVRGPYPGLGSILSAFGISHGLFVAQALQERVGENVDPWPEVDAAFQDPASVLPQNLRCDIKELASTWQALSNERMGMLTEF
jgi:hypothetical protein